MEYFDRTGDAPAGMWVDSSAAVSVATWAVGTVAPSGALDVTTVDAMAETMVAVSARTWDARMVDPWAGRWDASAQK